MTLHNPTPPKTDYGCPECGGLLICCGDETECFDCDYYNYLDLEDD